MNKISLKDWVILLTIIPTTLICLCVAGYFSYSRYVELNEFLTIRSESIIEPVAIASVEPTLKKDREKLRQLIGFAHRNHSDIVKSITIFTLDNQALVTSSYNGSTNIMRLNVGSAIPQQTSTEALDDYYIFRTPIINENLLRLHNTPNDKKLIIGYVSMQVDKNKIKFSQQSQMIVAFSIVIFGSLINALFSIRLIKNVTRPVSTMVQAVDRIREGKLESRVSGQLIGELNFLKKGINAMAQSLGDYQDEMQRSVEQATIDLRESLEQFEIQNVELDISKRKAQEANRVKSEFLANMSHELRTPLNGVIGFTRQVLKTPLSETQRDYLQTIERSANNLLAIINDILDFSKLDAGKMVIEKIPFTLRESIEETLTLLAPSAHKRNIELSLRISPHIPDSLIGDAMRVKQVLINLASNAIKFTEKGSVTIDVDSEAVSPNVTLFTLLVSDTGIGMSAAQQKTIFEAFGQADKSVTRLYGGTGLGLVISQRLANEMKGDVSFSSEEGRGSTFSFSFQCEVNPIPLETPLDIKELSKKRVLYYEPLTHSRIATSEIMEKWNMRVTPVNSLEKLSEALAKKEHYDFALLSHAITPTEVDDLKNLIGSIKLVIPSVHIAINSNSPSLQEAILASGALSCLSKPITPERLSRALQPQKTASSYQLSNTSSTKVPIKVLAVDDNEANLKLIKALLLEQVTEVITASNGKEALELCKHEMFAIIFMDIQMPIMDGVSALKTIKLNTFNDKTAVVAVTAHALSGEKEKLAQDGFNGYITKPIDETMLRHSIYEYCDLDHFMLSSLTDVNLDDSQESLLVPLGKPQQNNERNDVIDWPLALERTANKVDLAVDMLSGLVKILPKTKQSITEALTSQDIEQIKTLIHTLNGACCYTGVPSLGGITHHIETQLKKGLSLDDLEPEFFEFFEHLDNVMSQAPKYLKSLSEGDER